MKRTRLSPVLLAVVMCIPATAAERVRIGVLGLFHPEQIVVEASPSSPLLVDAGGKQIVTGVGAVQQVSITLAGEALIARSGERRLSGEKLVFQSRPGGDAEFVVSIPGKIRRRYRGKLIVTAAKRELLPAVEMDLETAVASIVAAESPANAPLEALKAQAIVSRSYLVAGGHRHTSADFCDTTHCQFLRQPPAAGSPAGRAARATEGLVLAWRDKPFASMYSASCGGRTHSLAELGLAPADYPYFSVECSYCRLAPERWSSRMSEKELSGLAAGDENERIKAGRRLGWNTLPSNTYTSTATGDAIDLHGVGRGHGIGLCQRGAAAMARDGQNFRAILRHYYPDTTVKSVSATIN